jgi:hypothetical protein
MSDERQADHRDDPRRQGTGQGYPESAPEEATPREGTESGPEADEDGGGAEAPGTTSPSDGDAGQATGNPDAAG